MPEIRRNVLKMQQMRLQAIWQGRIYRRGGTWQSDGTELLLMLPPNLVFNPWRNKPPYVEPPGDSIPINVDPYTVEEVLTDPEIREAVKKRFKNGRAGGA